MGHISPSFRRAYRTAKKQGFGREAMRSGQGFGAASVWRALGWQAKTVLGVSAAALLIFVLAPAEAASNADPAATTPAQPQVIASAAPISAEALAAPTVAAAPAQPDATRPAARPTSLINAATPAPAVEVMRGPVTRLPVPRYVSLKGEEGNVRRGPSLSHRIDWVFHHSGMPLRVVGEFGHWRRVEDRDGAGGWVHYQLLSGVRTAIIQQEMVELRSRPDLNAGVIAMAEGGAIVKLGECDHDWCRVSGAGAKGWLPKAAIWGVDPDETRD
jgi:SH3-like domain-containing protein